MNLEASKMRLETIEGYFANVKKSPFTMKADITKIERELSAIFGGKYQITVTKAAAKDPWPVMSVYPEKSVMDKVIDAVLSEQKDDVVAALWEKNTSWVIEIDRRTLDDSIIPISARELVALLLHEIGHITKSGTVPSRIKRVIQWKFAQLSSKVKFVLKDKKYKDLMQIPILDSLSLADHITTKASLRDELNADNFAATYGYGADVASVIKRILSTDAMKAISNGNTDSMDNTFKFIASSLESFAKRADKLAIESFQKIWSDNNSPYIEEVLVNIASGVFGRENYFESGEARANYITESINQLFEEHDNLYVEFFGLKKKLKPLRPYDIDYIAVQVDAIETYNDKLLCLSYIRGKLDTVDYYIQIMESDKYSKKFEVPHTMEFLQAYRDRLEKLLAQAQNALVKPKKFGIYIQCPEGYEG